MDRERMMMDERRVLLNVFFAKVSEDDTEGIIEITSEAWPDTFKYSNCGSFHAFQGEHIEEDVNMMAFGSELAILLRKYFSDVPPLHTPNTDKLIKDIHAE